MPLRVGIDVDGVLADFRTAFRLAARACLRREIGDSDDPQDSRVMLGKDVRRVWDWVAKRTNWWMELEPYEPDQIERLYRATRAAGWEMFFLTNRPPSAGDSIQFQTQWWIERHGFFLPSVLTVPGSRGDIANGLRLDLVVDDLPINCVEVVSASPAKALLMLRDENKPVEDHAVSRGIAVVHTLADAISALERLHAALPGRRGRLLRLTDWFSPPPGSETLPQNPRTIRPLPPTTTEG